MLHYVGYAQPKICDYNHRQLTFLDRQFLDKAIYNVGHIHQ